MTAATVSPDHAAFLGLLPAVRAHALFRFRYLPPVDRDEAAADAVAYAFRSFLRLRRRGADPAGFPAAFARVAARWVAAGRGVGRAYSTRDVMARAAQRRRGFAVHRLDAPRPDGRGWWREAAADPRAAVPDQAALNVDFPAWLAALPPAKRRAARLLVEGNSTGTTAALVGVTPGRISQLRRELAADWHHFHACA
jgi:hypothetical protein